MLDDYGIPDPAPGSVLMKIELCGVCGTDVHTWQSEVETFEYPVSLGHEIVGTVEAPGPSAFILSGTRRSRGRQR